MKVRFSLIVATYGREKEIDLFLNSILEINYDLKKIEVIIVDQNKEINLENIIESYKGKINVKHIKSNSIGLSTNRNIGLLSASGSIIAFPDDDCEYLEDTLVEVDKALDDSKADIVMGRIVERDDSDSLRFWSKEQLELNKNNFYKKCSSITLFMKRNFCEEILNEKLGAGVYFGACEDADIIYRNIKREKKVNYMPNIKIYHPHYDSNKNMPLKKIESYGLGFGAMVKSNLDINMAILFIKAQGYHFLKMLFAAIKLDFKKSKNSYVAFKSRFSGLIQYK